MKDSEFEFNLSVCSKSKWDINLKYTKNEKESKFDKEAILELRDRALLMQHTTGYKDRERVDYTLED